MVKKKCDWGLGDPLYENYHDTEWGVPVYDDQKLFEFLTLESFQAGLSWITILRKRMNFSTTFDGFEYFLYFESGSQSYPKSTTTYPYTLQSSTSTEVRTWLGSTDEDNLYYGGALLSASFYDEDNVNNLLYVIPEYIRSNPDNSNYILFIQIFRKKKWYKNIPH